MGILGGDKVPVNPDEEHCTLHEEQGRVVCEFGDGKKDRTGKRERRATVDVRLDESGNPIAKDGDFETKEGKSWTEQEKEYLKSRAVSQAVARARSNSGPMAGHVE